MKVVTKQESKNTSTTIISDLTNEEQKKLMALIEKIKINKQEINKENGI